MDEILNQATTTSFWAQVLLGQALFVAGIIWIVVSVRKDFQKANMTKSKNDMSNRGQGFY